MRANPTRRAPAGPQVRPRVPLLTSAGWPSWRCGKLLQLVPHCHLCSFHDADVRGPYPPSRFMAPATRHISVPPCAAGAFPTTPDASARGGARLTCGTQRAEGAPGWARAETQGSGVGGQLRKSLRLSLQPGTAEPGGREPLPLASSLLRQLNSCPSAPPLRFLSTPFLGPSFKRTDEAKEAVRMSSALSRDSPRCPSFTPSRLSTSR